MSFCRVATFVTMKRGLLVFLAICAFAIAMVPKERRAVNTEEQTEIPRKKTVCGRSTPCAWSVYTPYHKLIEFNITNTYCSCGSGTSCVQDEDDQATASFVYRCREPGHDEKKADN